MRHKCLYALALCLILTAPFCAAAEPLREDALETPVSIPLPPMADRPTIFALSNSAALLSLPDDPLLKAWPAVLILQDMLGADGRAGPYIENLLGAGIAVLELRDASAEAAHAAMAMLSGDPRFRAARLGVLGFGKGARVALGLPGPAARALLYPGCASLAVPPAASGAVLLLHGAEDPANSAEACARFCAALREAGLEATQREIPSAGYAWDYPALGEAQAALLPAAGGAERLHVRPWPAMAAQSAAEIAGFFAQQFSRGAP